jgi:serine/threonine protein kinase
MGEVYRARDTNLKRQVAIKVLPPSVAGNAERLTRFQREAEILAALNHPNIAHIHGLERSDGTVALVLVGGHSTYKGGAGPHTSKPHIGESSTTVRSYECLSRVGDLSE